MNKKEENKKIHGKEAHRRIGGNRMITISTNTRRFTIKAEEEQCERMFGKLVMELLEAAGGNFQEAKGNSRKAETAEGGAS